uniref:S-phase cyclin A-associated protein in the ER n=1 Tax=Neogobius melanostomus TaxID=47308 RepID=A0A8C6WNE4_9GOBI
MMWTYRLRASFQRSNSHDKVRKIVAEEGRAARNLIAWSVPLETKEEEGKQSKISSKAHRTVPGQQRSKKNAGGDGKSTSALLDKGVEKSPSKGRQPRKVDLRARYWAFLFENLRRAVDEIYVTCESDQSVVECREVLMMLDNYVRDFKALIDWIQLQEKLENTDAQNRPTSLAWEVRKMSPGRHVMASPSADRMVPSPGARRALTFGGPPTARLSHTGPSWADRVKCSQSLPHSSQTTAFQVEKPAKKDAEGWETVHRGRPAKPRSATMIAKVSPVVAQVPPKADHPKPKASQPPLKEPEATQGLCQPEQDPHPPQQDLPNEVTKMGCCEVLIDTCTLCLNSVIGATLRCAVFQPQSMAEVLAKKEELADRLEKANEEAIASAIAEEEQLTREIQAENNELETDNESDFSVSGSGHDYILSSYSNIDWSDMLADYDAREPWRQSTSWGDIVEEEPARYMTSKKKHEEKQLKAQQLRDKLREEKTLKLQKLLEREKDVRKWKEELLEQRRKMMEEKLLHAELKREVQLQAIVKKAQEEEAKVNEIAFINTLEAQNKRHDALAKLNEYEQRLNELQEERQRRQEEKQARDEAVQERKRVLEAERQARVEELLTKRKEQEARIEQQRQEKERAREDAARERARDREERLAALSAAQQEAMEELQKKIQMKHDESSRRHMEQMEQRKEKAAELSSGRHANTDYAPKLTPYERKKHCSLCSVMITSEVHLFSHTKGKRHQQAVRDSSSIQGRELSDEEVEHLSLKKYIVDIVPDTCVTSESVKDGEERQKARKKAKKLRARMNSRAKEYETSLEAKAQVSDSPYKAKLQRLVRDLLKQLQGQDSGQWSSSRVSALDRTLGEISRILEKQNNADQVSFQMGGGLLALEQILQVITAASTPSTVPRIPVKSLCAAVNTYYLTCASCSPNCSYVLFGNKITLLMDLLLHQLTLYVPDEDKTIFGRSVNKLVFEGLTTGLLQTISSILSSLWPPISESGERISSPDVKTKSSATEAFNTRTQDLISYVVNVGLIDKLYGCFLSVQTPVDDCPKMSSFLREASALLHSLCKLCFVVTGRAPNIFDNKRQDPTGLSSLLQSTDLVGVVHTLYSILLHTFPESSTQSHEPYSPGVIQVALHGIRFLNSFALLDLPAFQSVLGAEGLSLAFRHIVSSLLWYCSQHSSQALLHEVIICVGYFTVNHPDNQGIVQSGDSPVCCRSSVNCPSSTSVTQVILQHEMSCVLLATFIQLSNRFPRDQWDSALKFFLQKQEQS